MSRGRRSLANRILAFDALMAFNISGVCPFQSAVPEFSLAILKAVQAHIWKRAITTFLSRKFMITRSSIAFEDLLASSIAPTSYASLLVCLVVRNKGSGMG